MENTDPNRINILQKRLADFEDLSAIQRYDLRSLADCNHLREIAIDVLEEYGDKDNQEQRVALGLIDALEFLDFLNTKIVHLQRELKHTMEWVDDEARQ